MHVRKTCLSTVTMHSPTICPRRRSIAAGDFRSRGRRGIVLESECLWVPCAPVGSVQLNHDWDLRAVVDLPAKGSRGGGCVAQDSRRGVGVEVDVRWERAITEHRLCREMWARDGRLRLWHRSRKHFEAEGTGSAAASSSAMLGEHAEASTIRQRQRSFLG